MSEAYRNVVEIVKKYNQWPQLVDEITQLIAQLRSNSKRFTYGDLGNLLLQMTMNPRISSILSRSEQTALFNELMQLYNEEFTDQCTLDELFVICKNSGYLIGHCKETRSPHEVDGDIIAGMLTAIQTFVRQAFDLEEWENISIIHMGKIKMMIEHSDYLYAAVIFTGPDSTRLRERIKNLLLIIEANHPEALQEWDGTVEFLPAIQETIEQFFYRVNGTPVQNEEQSRVRCGSLGKG